MRLGFSHLNERKFKDGFNDTINSICICGGNISSINHFFLHCPDYCEARQNLFGNIQSIDKMLLIQNKSWLTQLTLKATPVLIHSFSTLLWNSHYLQGDSMDRYLTELKIFFSLISYCFLFGFVYLFRFVIFHLYLYPRCVKFFTSCFVACWFCCNHFFIFLAF